MLLREAGYTEKYSVRSVAGARRAKKVKGRELLMGYAAFPDMAILDKNFLGDKQYNLEEELKKLYCCVEAKKTKEVLLDIEGVIHIQANKKAKIGMSDISVDLCQMNGKATAYGELIGELLWYGRIIYTNGKEWRFLEIKDFDSSNTGETLAQCRKDLYKDCVKNKNAHVWCEKFEEREFEVIKTPLINIEDPEKTESDWEDFKATLRYISKDWKKKCKETDKE